MVQKILKFSLVFLLFFYVGTPNVYAQYDESNDEWINYHNNGSSGSDAEPGDADYDYGTGGGSSTLSTGTTSGGNGTWHATYNGQIMAISESNNARAAIWENICQNQGASNNYDNYFSLILNPDNCIPSFVTIIEYLASFHEVQNNGNTAFVDNTYTLITKASDEVLEKLIYYFPNNDGIRGLWFNNVGTSIATVNTNRSIVRLAIGARDTSESQYYNQVHPFDLWLEGKIRTYLLQTYNTVEFDNY